MRICVALLFWILPGCSVESADGMAKRARQAASASEWRSWAAEVSQRAITNSNELPRSVRPQFVRRFARGDDRQWQLVIDHVERDTNSAPLVMLISPGGFQSIGIIIGPPNYIEVPPTDGFQISREVYPGIYVRETN